MNIAIMGFGTVGTGAYEVAKTAYDINVKRILARHGREGYENLKDIITNDIEDIIRDKDIDVVIESMGGIEPARTYVLACLNAGKHVVTPNKNMLSAHFEELTETAAQNGVELRFTSTAGGGIPWLFNLMRTKRCDTITEVRGIVNGTCNYILDSMYDKGADFAEMLKIAQDLGYAEADPSSDIEGTDTLCKTVISANIAFDALLKEKDIPCYGIDTIEAKDISYLKNKGYTCKLLMNAKLSDGKIKAWVEPVACPSTSLEANVKANNNIITLVGESIGTQSFYGQGAGMLPTGESVIQDVIDIRDGTKMRYPAKQNNKYTAGECDEVRRYYIRHNKLCERIMSLVDTYEEKDGVFYCMSKPVTVIQMHNTGNHCKEKASPMFFAAIMD
ncbi:MAG TPA: homoserine dehydrogenase [Mogibacterium sp.]|nr:homoserine dehydrogenase [Mogibacterium sp.]